MAKEIVLTGVTTTGTPHLGNYVGAIKPAIEASQQESAESYFFLADYHALIKCHDPKRVHESAQQVAATWLACGLDTSRVTFYRQSDIPEITELTWVLTCMTAKGLMNRAHAYKAAVQDNIDADSNNDPDRGIMMGLFSYPVLMAADILMFNAQKVPVGKDQTQHLEMARDIAGKFNHVYGNTFNMPEAVVNENGMILKGLDGRKMSKSYDNTIPLFDTEKKFRKAINKIVTNSLEPGEPKDPDTCTVFELYSAFANAQEIADMRQRYADGIGWGDAKKITFEHLNEHLAPKREIYNDLINDPAMIDAELAKGAIKAREQATAFLDTIRGKVGIRRFS